MSLTSENGNGMVMPVAPMYGNGGFGGFGGLGSDAWLILIVLFAMGGWGGMGGFGGGMGLYPWMNQLDFTQGGFNQASTSAQLTGINNSITSGFASAEVAACQRSTNQLQTDYQNQIASMNQSFANAQALDSRLDNIVLNQQNCCCENRQAIADLKYTIATEAANTRAADQANKQAILDKLCALEIDGLKERNLTLQNQLNMATFRESQSAQDNYLQNALTALGQYLRPPINPAFIVNPPYQIPTTGTTGGTTTA
ncbi:MAG: hypothetical protein IJP92_14180 [Lachnospiraceae bacterium]|nr:hypothetical protein [Lachnospiraceae bacterium]